MLRIVLYSVGVSVNLGHVRLIPNTLLLSSRIHLNVAAVALANKLARIVWAVLAKNEPYRQGRPSEQPSLFDAQ